MTAMSGAMLSMRTSLPEMPGRTATYTLPSPTRVRAKPRRQGGSDALVTALMDEAPDGAEREYARDRRRDRLPRMREDRAAEHADRRVDGRPQGDRPHVGDGVPAPRIPAERGREQHRNPPRGNEP